MKKGFIYFVLLAFCFLFANESKSNVTNIAPFSSFDKKKIEISLILDSQNTPKLIYDISEDDNENEWFYDDETDENDDDFHKEKEVQAHSLNKGLSFLSNNFYSNSFSNFRNVKLFILFCSLKYHC